MRGAEIVHDMAYRVIIGCTKLSTATMRIFALAVASVSFFTGILAQSPTIANCPSVTSATLTSPSASCTVTACAACDNGNYVSSQTSIDSRTLSSATSGLSSALNSATVRSSVVVSQLNTYGGRLSNPNIILGQQTCLSASDVYSLLDSLAAAIDQLDNVLQTFGTGIQAALGSTNYHTRAVLLIGYLGNRVYLSYYYLWLSQGCVDWSQVARINNKIDAFNIKYPNVAYSNGSPIVPHLDSPCRKVLSYSTTAGVCAASSCRATPLASIVCGSCQAAPASTSAFQSYLSAAGSTLSAALAYATATPYKQADFTDLMNAKATADSLALNALNQIQREGSCMSNDQAHTYLTSLTTYVNSMAWSLQQAAPVEYAAGGPIMFVNRFAVWPTNILLGLSQTLQVLMSDPSSCYDCNDALAYNSAIDNFYARFHEYVAFRGLSTDPGSKPLLTVGRTSVCPSSSLSSSVSSTLSSSVSAESASSSIDSSGVSSAESASSSAGSGSDSSVGLSSASSAESVSSSVEPSGVSFVGSASAGPIQLSSPSPSFTSAPTFVDSASVSSSVSAFSAESLGSNASSLPGPSVTAAETSSQSSILADSLSEVSMQSSGYFNLTSVPSTTSDLPTDSLSTKIFTDAAPHTLTSTIVVTEPCAACPGGHTTFTRTLGTTSESTSAASTRTFTETTVVSEACPKCPGGSTTYASTYLTGKPILHVITTTAAVTADTSPTAPAATPSRTSVTITTVTQGCSKCSGGSTTYTSEITVSGESSQPATGISGVTPSTFWTTGPLAVPVVSSTAVVDVNSGNKLSWSLVFLLVPVLLGLF